MTNRTYITEIIKTVTENKDYSEFENEIPQMVDDIIVKLVNSTSSRLYQLEQGIQEAATEASIYGIRSIRVKLDALNVPSADQFINTLKE